MSSNALLAALLVASATATAQTSAPQSGAPAPAQENAAPATQEGTDSTEERIRQEVEKRVEAAKQEMREEIRAQLATQSLATDWQEEWVEEKRKLEVFSLDGYYRLRPKLYHQFGLGKIPERRLFPSPRPTERTQSGADMRLRLDPTFNISEEVRIKTQFDVLDNVMLGSTPSRSFPDDGFYLFDIFNDGQTSPKSAINALRDSISVRELYGEVTTPVGLLRFGRMTANWGLGMLRNDGNCLDCDYGDVVDRVMFVTEPFDGFYVTPMFDFNSEGPYAYPQWPAEPAGGPLQRGRQQQLGAGRGAPGHPAAGEGQAGQQPGRAQLRRALQLAQPALRRRRPLQQPAGAQPGRRRWGPARASCGATPSSTSRTCGCATRSATSAWSSSWPPTWGSIDNRAQSPAEDGRPQPQPVAGRGAVRRRGAGRVPAAQRAAQPPARAGLRLG